MLDYCTNTAAWYGKKVAALFHLSNIDGYAGYCWRVTSLTWAANAGLSLNQNQIRAISDHRCDAVVQ
jgi:hypothetical protein